jgi:hypothetical protein
MIILFRSRSRDVVLVWRTIDQGVGNLEWGGTGEGFEEGEVSSRATWGQGGRDRTTQKEGFQVSKSGLEGESKRDQQGE